MKNVLIGGIFAFGLLHAGTIDLDSQPGLANSVSGATVLIGTHPWWQTNNPQNPGDPNDTSAVWISYGSTGFDGPVFQPFGGLSAVASIFHTFTSGAGALNLQVWSDDTTQVYLDDVPLTQHEVEPIGFAPDRSGTFTDTLTEGNHKLEFRMFQLGLELNTHGNPFGLLYTGTATAASDPFPPGTPEPGTSALLLTGVTSLVLGRKYLQRRP